MTMTNDHVTGNITVLRSEALILDNISNKVHKLSWSPHIEKKVSKAKKFLHLIKSAINHIWGLNPKRMQWIYKQIILPRLTYGCHVWGHSLNNDQISKLGSVERLALAYHAPM